MEERSYNAIRVQEGIDDSFTNYRKQALKAARDFHYPEEVINKIKMCTTIGQLSVVMTTARQTYL